MLKKIYQWFLPYTCVLCKAPSDLNMDLCRACKNDLPWIKEACLQCGRPLPLTLSQCGQCIKETPIFDYTHSLFQYRPPIDQLITALKFQQQLLYAKILGELFSEKLEKIYQNKNLPELIIPVPLHPSRLSKRGFNQSLELAKPIAKKLKLPIDLKHCQRPRATVAQSLLPAEKRAANVKKAFLGTKNLVIKRVAIVDDVITTGHTVNELSFVLRQQGVEEISIWCIAHSVNYYA